VINRTSALLAVAVAIGACTATPAPSLSIPRGGTPSPAVTSPSQSPSTAATLPPSPAGLAIPITCGAPGAPIDLRTCLSALSVAVQGVSVDPVSSASLLGPSPTGGWPPPSRSRAGSTNIEVQVVPTLAFDARFESPTSWEEVPLYVGDPGDNGGWGLGPPPSDGRIWTVTGNLPAWSDPESFALEAFDYVFQVGCRGAGVAGGEKGRGTAILESISGGSSAVVGRLTCGPVATGDVESARLSLASGTYRLRFENVGHALSAQLLPAAEWR